MDVYKETQQSYLKLFEVYDIAIKCGVASVHVESLLHLIHEMGSILWLDEIGFRDTIILDAIKYLVQPITLVVCNHRETFVDDLTRHHLDVHKIAAINHGSEWWLFCDKGFLKNQFTIIGVIFFK